MLCKKLFFIIGLSLLYFSEANASLALEEERVIVRTWFSVPTKEAGFFSKKGFESAGHVSLEIPSKKTYLSLWPDDTFLVADREQGMKAKFVESYYEDVLNMERQADNVICIYSLDAGKMASQISSIKKIARLWKAIAGISFDFSEHNCASIVLSVLMNQKFSNTTELLTVDENNSRATTMKTVSEMITAYDTINSIDIRIARLDSLLNLKRTGIIYQIPYYDQGKILREEQVSYLIDMVNKWKKSINQGVLPLSPCPKIHLQNTTSIITPSFANLWVRNFSIFERANSFRVGLMPPYEERVVIKGVNYSCSSKEVDISYWSWKSLRDSFIRTYVPGYRSYFFEHVLWTSALIFASSVVAEDSPSGKATRASVLYSVANSLYTLIRGKFYGRSRRIKDAHS